MSFGLLVKRAQQKQRSNQEAIKMKTIAMSFAYEDLMTALGGVENITSSEATLSKVRINYRDKSLIDVNKISSLKEVTGIMMSSQAINIIVGNAAKQIHEYIAKERENE